MISIRNDRFGAPIETFGRQRAKKTHAKEHTQTLINSHLQQFFFSRLVYIPPFWWRNKHRHTQERAGNKVMIIHGINSNSIQKHLTKANKMNDEMNRLFTLLNKKRGNEMHFIEKN